MLRTTISETAYAFETDRQQSFDAGCNEYLTKPVDADKLIYMVYNYLKNNSFIASLH